MIEQTFFELIQVAIGTRLSLSRNPKEIEWGELYEMAKKQSLVGICFAGVQKVAFSHPSFEGKKENESSPKGEDLGEALYLTWMGMAAKIQQRNEIVNRQCAELQRRLADDGFRSCILKGQGVAALYRETNPQPSHGEGMKVKSHTLEGDESIPHSYGANSSSLAHLRQSGDIDVWIDAPKEKIVEWARVHGGKDLTGELHVDCKVFPNTAVELHFTPSIASNPKINRRLQKWFEEQKPECFKASPQPSSEEGGSLKSHPSGGDIVGAPIEFNLVYIMHHIFRHYLYEGIGLRQIMDYYMVLKEASLRLSPEGKREVLQTIKALGMERFLGALLWVIGYVFEGNPEYYKSFPLGEDLGEASKRGKRLLEVIMEGGNFGHGTEIYKITGWDKPWSRLSRYVRRNWYMMWDYPDEVLGNMMKKMNL